MSIKKFLSLLLSLALAFCLIGCGEKATEGKEPTPDTGEEATAVATNHAVIKIKDQGEIKLELYGNIAPITVENFVKLARDGFYNGLTFHRIIKGFMIQGGDPEGTGIGGSDEKIKGEFTANGVKNNISHERGVISMARSRQYNSASSQFFIMHETSPHLDGQYAAFGKVTEGMEIVDALAENTPVTDSNGSVNPDNQPIIESIVITD